MSQGSRRLHRDRDIYASTPLRQLADAQTRAMLPQLQRSAGTCALSLGVRAGEAPPALPLVGFWTQLWLGDDGFHGDVRAAGDEPLPFLDETFDVVLLRHALEVAQAPEALLDEAIRVLAPGGSLVLTGVHPVSGWAPWFYWRARGRQALRLPLRLGYRLQRQGVEIAWVRRVGRVLPSPAASRGRRGAPWGGGYVLMARKPSRLATPFQRVPARAPLPRGRLSPGTRRSSAM